MALRYIIMSLTLNTLLFATPAVAASSTGELPSVALIPTVSQPLESPVFVTHANDQSGRIYIVEQSGRIRIVQDGRLLEAPLLDISEHVLYGYECGLLGLAFHPQYRENGRFFVNYSTKDGCSTVVAEYRRRPDGTGPAREHKIILAIPQPDTNHNGGMLAFGPDGLLYIGMGDGGGIGDPQNRSQDLRDLLGKMLRIDVDRGLTYAVPPDNPFAPEVARAEIYATGLRNPWRYSFDRETGQLWLADVGLKGWEEINVITKAGNYGWSTMEGSSCFKKKQCNTTGLILPLIEYRHEDGRCSITGGYVYRGRNIPALVGAYLYGDYCSGEVFGVRTDSSGQVTGKPWRLLETEARISSFGEDEQGELYLVDHRGTVYRLGPVRK